MFTRIMKIAAVLLGLLGAGYPAQGMIQEMTPAQKAFVKTVLKCGVTKNNECIIQENLGGVPMDYRLANSMVKFWNTVVAVDGKCGSACFSFTTWGANICITPRAVFSLHRQKGVSAEDTLQIKENEKIRELIKSKGELPWAERFEDGLIISSDEMLATGVFQPCEVVNGRVVFTGKTALK